MKIGIEPFQKSGKLTAFYPVNKVSPAEDNNIVERSKSQQMGISADYEIRISLNSSLQKLVITRVVLPTSTDCAGDTNSAFLNR